jgi:spore maturation protein CgeB
MRVLILGEDAPGGLMASYARGFNALGVDVHTYCLVRAYQSVAPAIRLRALRRAAEPVLLVAFNERVIRDLSSATVDLVFVLKGHRLRAETVRTLRERIDAPVVNFFPDDPFSRERSNRLAYGPAVLGAYDACFTFARHLIRAYEEAGASSVHYLPFARDPELHAPITRVAPPPDLDVVFVGNLDDERIRFLDAIARTYRVGVFGERTTAVVPRRSALTRAVFGPAAYGPALAQTLARGAISLNVMRPQNSRSHNMRSFESPACGAFTLSQRTPELTELFVDDEEIATFDGVDELRAAVDRWLTDRRGRVAVARAGYARVRDDTYARRAAVVLDTAGIAMEVGS